MDEVFYTKETGWTEAGIAEQERRRRVMETDLTKLTADELRVRFDVLRPKLNVPARLVLAEIGRRLEELEQFKAASRAKAIIEALHHNSAELIEREDLLRRLEILEARDRNWDSLYTVACAERDKANALLLEAIGISNTRKERLEKCEAALRKARTLLISEGDPDEDGEMIAEIDELLGEAGPRRTGGVMNHHEPRYGEADVRCAYCGKQLRTREDRNEPCPIIAALAPDRFPACSGG